MWCIVWNNRLYVLLSGFTDRSRPPLTVSRRAGVALSSPENLKCWTVKKKKNGARFYNKAMSSEMPFQDPHNWVGTTRRDTDTYHSIYCSSTETPVDSHHLSLDLAQFKPPLGSQAGASLMQRLDSGGGVACSWLTLLTSDWRQLHFNTSLAPVESSHTLWL